MVHEIGHFEIAGAHIFRDQGIAIERQKRDRGRKNRAALLIGAVQHVPCGSSNDGMGLAIAMGVGKHVLIKRVDLAGGIGKRQRDLGQASGLAFGLLRIKHMKHRAREKGMGGFRPMVDEALAFRIDEDGDEVLHVTHLVQGPEPDFFERIEAGSSLRRTWIEAKHRVLRVSGAPPRRQVPKLGLLIVDDDAVGPGQKRRHDEAHALAAAGGRDRKHMLGAVMTQIMQALFGTVAPGADINPLPAFP